MTRRQLAAGAGALLATHIFPRLARGANDRIAVGFIGIGTRGGDGLLPDFLSHPDCQISAVCDTFRDRCEHRARQIDDAYARRTGSGSYKSAVMYADFREMLLRKDLDAIVIATPDHWHVPLLAAAVRAGKEARMSTSKSRSVLQLSRTSPRAG
jgi:hypothetical protein